MSDSVSSPYTARASRRIGAVKRVVAGAGLFAAVMSLSLLAAGAASANPVITDPVTTIPGPTTTVSAFPTAGITINGVTTPLANPAAIGQPVPVPNIIVTVPTHNQQCSILDIIDQSCLPGVGLNLSLAHHFNPGLVADVGIAARGFVAFAAP